MSESASSPTDVRPPALESTRQRPSSPIRLVFPFVLDYFVYDAALNLVAFSTFLPMFLRTLTPSNIIIGLIPTIQVLGATLPTAILSPTLERRPRLKPLMLAMAAAERAPLLLIGPWILLSGGLPHRVTLGGILLLWACYSTGSGCVGIVWLNLVARVVPAQLRGRMAGWGVAVATLPGIGMAALARYLFQRYGLGTGYGLALTGAGLLISLSALSFTLVREQAHPSAPGNLRLWSYLGRLPALLHQDRTFGWFMASRLLWTIAATAGAFYTVYAIDRFRVGPNEVTWLTVSMAVGSVLASVIGGAVADARGNRLILLASALFMFLGPLLAIMAGRTWLLLLLFAIESVGQRTGILGGQNMPLELAPQHQVAGYLAVNNLLLGPARALIPVIAGALIEWTGYAPFFVISGVAALLSAFILFRFVPEPRHRPPHAASDG